MGTRWESVFIRCNEAKLAEVAEAAKELLPYVFRGRLSLDVFRVTGSSDVYSIECTGFRAGPLPLTEVPSGALGLSLQAVSNAVQRSSGSSAELALAILASSVLGNATWLYYSDATGQSAGAWFSHGTSTRTFRADDTTEPDFTRAFVAATSAFVPGIEYVDDDLLNAVYEGESVISLPVSG